MLKSLRNTAIKYGAIVPMVAAGNAFAALPVGVTQAVDDGKADMLAMAGLMLAVFIALVAFKLIRRAAH